MKKHYTIPISIGLITAIFSLGGAWALVKSKADEVDKIKDKTEVVSTKVAVLENNIENIKESMSEQKDNTEKILKILMEKHNR